MAGLIAALSLSLGFFMSLVCLTLLTLKSPISLPGPASNGKP